MFRPEIDILELPPAFGQSKYEIQPPLGSRDFEKNEQSSGSEQFPNVLQRETQIRRRVQNVRCQDDVETVRLESLNCGRPFDIQNLIFRTRILLELLPRSCHEERRHISENILRSVRSKVRQD